MASLVFRAKPAMHCYQGMEMILNMAKKNQTKKPREQTIEFYADITDEKVELTYDLLNDSISLKGATINNAKIETSYEKNSGRTKLTNSTPIKSSELSFSCDRAIFENYDVVIAIDTNTKFIRNKLISVTSSYFINKPIHECNKTNKYPFIPFAAHLFVDIQDSISPEKLGWYVIISSYIQDKFPTNYRIGIIVDCDLGAHDLINDFQTPYFESLKLPQNIQFIYASSDKRTDSIANQMINYSDKLASSIINSEKLIGILDSDKLMNSLKYCEGHCPVLGRPA